ncbi:methyltransferase, partial [Candidatus Poribacteria bacterium]|nr:methyltransferase [Candidatus Poribacteria bacterium]
MTLYIKVDDDLETLTYYEVLDDSRVFRADGSVDYKELEKHPLATFPSSHLLSPERYMRHNFSDTIKEVIDRIWPEGKRYTNYRGIIVSWDKGVDRNVWTTNIDTVYLHRCLENSGLLESGNIHRAIEIGTGGGHLSVLLASRIPQLEELSITDISHYALRAAKRNILPFLAPRTRLRTYRGKGLGTVKGAKADLIVVNPPYIPSPPFDSRPSTDPYRGTGLIREVLEEGIYKLNPNNPEASIVINISSLAAKDFAQYLAEFGDRFEIEPLGEPLRVPLKIRSISKEWKDWLVAQGLLEYHPEFDSDDSDQEPYWHTLQVYRIRPKPGVVKSWAAKRQDRIEREIYANTEALIKQFKPLLNTVASRAEASLRRLFPEIYGYLYQLPEAMNYDAQPALLLPERNLSLVSHIIARGFGRKLLGLEKQDMALFQDEPGISHAEFERLCAVVSALRDGGLLSHVRCAFLHHDVAKAGLPQLRQQWSQIPGIDLRIPNKAAGLILRNKESPYSWQKGLFENIALFSAHPQRNILNEFFYRVIETRGFAGQWVRGEVSYEVFEDFTSWIRANFPLLTEAVGCKDDSSTAARRIADIIYLLNFLDAASIREGLMTSRLNSQFIKFFDDFCRVITPQDGAFLYTWDDIFSARWDNFKSTESQRAYLKDRFGRFRQERRDEGEPKEAVDTIVDAMSPQAIAALCKDLQHF